ncbi:unnamed protein product, partial [Cuscuta epithymum]
MEGGRWERDREALGRMVEDYFINVFSSVQGDRDYVLRCVSRKIEDHHNLELLRTIRAEEVKEAVFSMYPDKSPGPDGMSPGFFQHFWDVIGPDVVDYCRTAFESGRLPDKASQAEALTIRGILQAYESASGQMINFNKSKFFFSANVTDYVKKELTDLLQVGYAGEEERYLGLPALFGKGKREILGYLRNRVIKKLQNWNNRFLSKAGREILLKTVIQAMPTYAMNVFLLPVDLCREIEVIMNGYWWNGHAGKGIRWRSWDFLCRPKTVGGMGFRKVREFNLAMLAKQAWKLLTETETLAARVFRARYYPGGSYLTAKIGNNPSFIWRSLVEVQKITGEGVRWRVGDGSSINIWRDPWLPDKDNPRVSSECFHGLEGASVAGLFKPLRAGWDEDILVDLFNARDRELIKRIPVSNRSVTDRLVWAGEQNGSFTVKSCYRRITGDIFPVGWVGWTAMWRFNLPPKMKSFFWQVCTGCLPTTENLRRRGVACEIKCGLCGQDGDESLLHLFVKCQVAREAWGTVRWLEVGQLAHDFLEWLELNFKVLKKEDIAGIISGCWGLWGERNQRVWKMRNLSGLQVMLKTRSYVDSWVKVQQPTSLLRSKLTASAIHWQRPGAGRRKVNVDASTGGERCGFGWVVRDSYGIFLAGGCTSGSGKFTPLEAELMGVREALSWLKAQQWDFIDVESDSLLAIQEIQRGSSLSYSGILAEDIRDLMTNFVSIIFSHVRRSANRAAHALAKAAGSLSDSHVWFFTSPPF